MATCCLETGSDIGRARLLTRAGRLSIEDLLDLLEEQDRLRRLDLETIRRQATEIERLKERLEQYEANLPRASAPSTPPENPPVSYSLAAEEKRRRPRHRIKKSPGRRPTELKWPEAKRYENVLPDGRRLEDCVLVRERCVWRLQDNGRAVRIGYRIYGDAGETEPSIPGVPRRCEYGIEILVVLAYLVYVIGLSLRKACAPEWARTPIEGIHCATVRACRPSLARPANECMPCVCRIRTVPRRASIPRWNGLFPTTPSVVTRLTAQTRRPAGPDQSSCRCCSPGPGCRMGCL
jgi:hypothetical protein